MKEEGVGCRGAIPRRIETRMPPIHRPCVPIPVRAPIFYGVLTVIGRKLCSTILMSRLLRCLSIFLLGVGGISAEVTDKAEKYHRLLLKKPGNVTVFDRFVEAWLDADSKDELQTWLEEKTKSGMAVDWQILASLHDYLGENEEAVSALDQAIKKDEGNLSLRLARAEMMGKSLDFEAALDDLALVVADANLAMKATKLQGIYLARIGRPEEAVETWEKLVERFPEDEDLREDLIEVEVMEGLYKEAIEASLELIKRTKDPYQKALRQLRLAEVYLLGDLEEDGLKTYKAILAATGEGSWLEREVFSQVERVFALEENVKGIREFYQGLRETYPRRVSVRKALARQMARNGELVEAIALFREILKITPGDLGNREEFIAMLEVHGEWKEARGELRDLIKQKGNDPLLWERLVKLEEQLGNEEGLKVALAKLRDLKGGSPDGVIAVAEAYAQVHLNEEAEAILREGRMDFPLSDEVVEALASHLMTQENPDEARELWLSMAESGERDDVLRVARSMTSHQLRDEAFELLLGYATKEDDDSLVLTQLGKLASSEEQTIKVLPLMQNLVRLSKAPTDLENAITLASGIIRRSDRMEQLIVTLEETEDLSIGEQCLLADLQSQQGDLMKARRTLVEAGDSLLAKFYQVRFEEKQGDLSSAILRLHEIVQTPEGMKTVHLRRLVSLYQQSGRLREALEQVNEWKKTAPGDQQAWITRANLLTESGRLNDAVAEHRRLIGKFGPNAEHRERLAEVLQKSGDAQSAEKIYEKLYKEAQDLPSKLKWVSKWAELAQDAGRVDRLIARFTDRRDTQRRAVEPLLVLAEIYQVTGQSEERKNALTEAARRRPEDSKFLVRMAEEAGRAGDLEFAIATLREVVSLDQGETSKRALAKLLIRYQEVDEGLAILQSIPGEGKDPRHVERTVSDFAQAGEWEAAEIYLKGMLIRHPDDWRLGYLHGILLKKTEQQEKALAVFRSLDRDVGPLTGLPPIAASPQAVEPFHSITGKSPLVVNMESLLSQLRQGQGEFSLRGSRYITTLRGRTQSAKRKRFTFYLPSSPEFLRSMTYVQTVALASASEKEKDKADFDLFIEQAEGERRLFLLSAFRSEEYRDFLLRQLVERPDDLRLSLLWLGRWRPDEKYLDETRKAFSVLQKESPVEAIRILSRLVSGKVIPSDDVPEVITKIYRALPDEKKSPALDLIMSISYLQTQTGKGDPSLQSLDEFVKKELLTLDEAPGQVSYLQIRFQNAINEGRGDDAVALANRCLKWWFENPNFPRGVFPVYRRSRNTLGPPVFPTWEGVGWLYMRRIFNAQSTPFVTEMSRSRNATLLDELLDGVDESLITKLIPTEVMKPHGHKIEHPIYRGLIFRSVNDEEALAKLVVEMSGTKDKDQLRFAAAHHAFKKDYLESYRILLKIKTLSLERGERNLLDGNLAYTANMLDDEEAKKVDLDPAREAILRVQSRSSKGSLAGFMRKLGLGEEAERADRIEKLRTSRKKVPRAKKRVVLTGTNLIKHELSKGDPDRAVREVLKILKKVRGDVLQNRDVRKIVPLFKEPEHIDLLLKVLRPGKEGLASRWYQYASIAFVLGKNEEAEKGYNSFLVLSPDHPGALVGRILSQDPKERDWSIFSPKLHPDLSLRLFPFLIYHRKEHRPTSYDLMMKVAELSLRFLKEYKFSEESPSSLMSISSFYSTAVRHYRFDDFEIDPILGTSKASSEIFDQEKSLQRVASFKSLCEEMLNHEGLAKRAFLNLHSASALMDLSDDDLYGYANRAYVQSNLTPLLKNPSGLITQINTGFIPQINTGYQPTNLRGSWDRLGSSYIPNPVQVNSFSYLLSLGREKKRAIFTEDTLALLKEKRPLRYQSYLTACEICESPRMRSREVYLGWAGSLPKEAAERAKAVEELTSFLISFAEVDAPWVDEHQKLLVESLSEPIRSAWLAPWSHWILSEKGRKGFYQLSDQIFVQVLGDRTKWPVLSQLSQGHWPAVYKKRNDLLTHLLRQMAVDRRLLEPSAAAIRSAGLERLQLNQLSSLRSEWGKQVKLSPEVLMLWMKGNGGLGTGGEVGFPDPAKLIVFCEALEYLKSPTSSNLTKLKPMLEGDKELDPLMKGLLMSQFGIDIDIPTLVETHLEAFQFMADLSPEQTSQLFARWFPDFETATAGPKSSIFIADLVKELRRSSYDDVMKMAERTGSAYAFVRNKRSWTNVAKVAAYAPLEVARAIETLMIQAAVEVPGKAGGPSPVDYEIYLKAFTDSFEVPRLHVSLTNRVKCLHRLYSGELRDRLINHENETQALAKTVGEKLNVKIAEAREKNPEAGQIRTITEALLPFLKDLTTGERRLFLLAVHPGHFNVWNSREDPVFLADFGWLNSEVRKEYPIVCDFLSAAFTGSLRSGDLDEEEMRVVADQGTRDLLRFLEESHLPSMLRMKMARYCVRSGDMKQHLNTPRHWDWISGAIDDYEKSDLRKANQTVAELIGSLNDKEVKISDALSPRFRKIATDYLVGQTADRRKLTKCRSVAAGFVRILLSVSDLENSSRLIEAYPASFKGDLATMWKLFEMGGGEMVTKINDPQMPVYRYDNFPDYGWSSPGLMAGFLEAFPKDQRFYIEFLIASRSDATGLNTPAKTRDARMMDLAKRFQEEAPESRLQALHFLGEISMYEEAASQVMPQLREEEKRHRLGPMLKRQNGEKESNYLSSIIITVIERDLAEGKFESAKRQYQSICGFSGLTSNAIQFANRIVGRTAFEAVKSGWADQKKAKELLPLANFFFRESLRLGTADYLKLGLKAEGFAFLQHLIANEEEGWVKMIGELGKTHSAKYAQLCSQKPFAERTHSIRSALWNGDENMAMRIEMQKALFHSNTYQKEARDRPRYSATHILTYGLALGDETVALLNELPKELDRAHFFLWQQAVAGGVKAETLDQFKAARKVARDKGEGQLEAEILTDHAWRLVELDRKEEALEIAKQIDVTLLKRKARIEWVENLRTVEE